MDLETKSKSACVSEKKIKIVINCQNLEKITTILSKSLKLRNYWSWIKRKQHFFSLNPKILLEISFGSRENGENGVSILGNFQKLALDLRYLVKIGLMKLEKPKLRQISRHQQNFSLDLSKLVKISEVWNL